MKIIELGDKLNLEWNKIVESGRNARFSQIYEFRKVIENTFNIRTLYPGVQINNQLILVLPLAVKNSDTLVSISFAEHGGFLFKDIDINLLEEILNEISEFCLKKGFKNIYLHGYIEKIIAEKYNLLPAYYSGIIELKEFSNLEEYLKKLSKKIRYSIRKSNRYNFDIIKDDNSDTGLGQFYNLYLLNMKRLGVPPFPMTFFLEVKKNFKDKLKIFSIKDDEKMIAAVLFLISGKNIYISDIVSDSKYWHTEVVKRVCYEVVKFGIMNGFDIIDFGGARDKGQIIFKKKFLTFEKKYYYYILKNGKLYNDFKNNIFFDSKLYIFFTFIWKNVIPLRLTKIIGPKIRKIILR